MPPVEHRWLGPPSFLLGVSVCRIGVGIRLPSRDRWRAGLHFPSVLGSYLLSACLMQPLTMLKMALQSALWWHDSGLILRLNYYSIQDLPKRLPVMGQHPLRVPFGVSLRRHVLWRPSPPRGERIFIVVRLRAKLCVLPSRPVAP